MGGVQPVFGKLTFLERTTVVNKSWLRKELVVYLKVYVHTIWFDLQVSSWGGYVFLINLIPLHVMILMITGRFSHRVYVAYSTVS